ncbi:MAG: hypothetical protein II171_07020 [Bacteroidales bacterium]|nr:hypothetical protein [Bacteroidales bacterium]
MKKWIICVAMLLSAVTAWGQSYRIVVDPGVPAPAAEVLCERFTQMLEAGGLTVVADTVTVAQALTAQEKVAGNGSQAMSVQEKVAGNGSQAMSVQEKVGNGANSQALTVQDGAPVPETRTLTVQGKVVSRMETAGELSQVMLAVEVEASCGDVQATFPLKGVGTNEEDAWLRAVKQLLPRSKAAQAFVSQL